MGVSVRKPGLLDGNLREIARLDATGGSVTFRLTGAGEATINIPEGGQAAGERDWVSIYTQRGLAGIYRVSNAAQTYGERVTLTLLHGIDILSDSVWDEQTTFTGTRTEYLRALLAKQTQRLAGQIPWQLGRCEDGSQVEREINYERLSDLLAEMEEEGGDYFFAYDQSSYPWTLHYLRKSEGESAEFRLARNVSGATVTYNDADLCTRLHLSVNVATQDEDTGTSYTQSSVRTYNNEAAQARWGIVTKTADIDAKDDIEGGRFPSADAWADNYMRLRAEPSVQIQIEGRELCALTGDTWDELDIGRLCRVALPDYGQTFLERAVEITYADFLGEPDRVRVSLANTLPQFSDRIASARRAAASASKEAKTARRGGGSAKDLLTWSQIVRYYGEALDGTGVMTLYESGIAMDPVSGVKIYSLQQGLESLYGGITVNSRYIDQVVQKTGVDELGEGETILSRLHITAEGLNALSGFVDEQGELIDGAMIDINGLKREIQLKVSEDGVIAAINLSPEEARIQARRIVLDGYVTASQLSVVSANVDNIINGNTQIKDLRAFDARITNAFEVKGHSVQWKSAEIVTDVSISTQKSDAHTYRVKSAVDTVLELSVPAAVTSVSRKLSTTTINYLGY